MKQPSTAVLDLILEYEVGGGKEFYNKYLTHPTWPGGYSGLTLGIGIDCGYYTSNELANMFSFLNADQLDVIKNASGKTGEAGRAYVKSEAVKNANITITWDEAIKIFDNVTWSKYARLAERAFPGLDQLCDNAYGAIVSLVFNRGTSMNGDSRLEMRNIRVLVPKKDYKGIAEEFRKMKRVWEGKGLDGLIARREAEAKLVETCS
jgi:GH24 family phage-related lysozyme (muramidase)